MVIYFIINYHFLNFMYEKDILDQVTSFPLILF